MNTTLKNISAISRKACFTAIIAVATLAAGAQSASADIKIEFSKQDANLTKVVLKFDMNGLASTGQKMNPEFWNNPSLPIVASVDNGKNQARGFMMRGRPAESKNVMYLETGGKPTKVEIFHKDLDIRGNSDLNSGFSWAVGNGSFAIDQTVIDQKAIEATFYIRKPLAGVIHPDALGKTITNGKVTITSTK